MNEYKWHIMRKTLEIELEVEDDEAWGELNRAIFNSPHDSKDIVTLSCLGNEINIKIDDKPVYNGIGEIVCHEHRD